MEFGQVGNNAVAACPFCDKLYVEKTTAGHYADTMPMLLKQHAEHLAEAEGCRAAGDAQPSLTESIEQLRPVFAAANTERQSQLEANPDNGKPGWWRVDGVRHDATAKASSAIEAVAKCEAAGLVGSWESADATFIGEELPEAF